MQSDTIEQQILATVHNLPLDKKQTVLEFSLFIKSMVNKSPETPLKRQAGLGKGSMRMSDDFDAPLPDSFWFGEE
jgi:hypothetical protein